MDIYTIDAKGRKLGRVASEAASVLLGKNSPEYVPNKTADIEVHIANTSKLFLTESKKKSKKYQRYSGYPGGLKEEVLESVLSRKGVKEMMSKAVRGMLPSNKLRKEMLKRLKISE